MSTSNVVSLKRPQNDRPEKGATRRPGPPRPTRSQMAYLKRGLDQAGGKLPLFNRNGQRYSERTIRSCIEQGWAEPWFNNALKPDWLVCRLTDAGRKVLSG